MDVGLLGPLEVREDGRALPLGGRKQRAVLAVLALSPNRTLSTERIVDELWGEDVPETAVKMVQIYVSQLRKVLPGDVLRTRAPGYVLEVEPDRIDLVRFERLLAQGRDALAAGDAESAARRFRESLALWRGPAFAEFAAEPFGQAEAARLEELHLSAVEERIEAELALGRHVDLVGELEAQVARHPLRERLRRQHMLALYRSGRQADALAAYQEARETLSERLGIEPSQVLRDLERQILNQDPVLDAPTAGRGPRALAARPTRPSRRSRPLVGREAELEQLRESFEEALSGVRRIVFVSGESGAGKSALVDAMLSEVTSRPGVLAGRGQCVEQHGAGEPYMPVLEALDRMCREQGGEEVVAHLGDRAPTWLVQMPWLVDEETLGTLQQRAVGATRERMLREFLAALEALTLAHPLVLAIDDLHWSDPSTLDLLAAISRRMEHASLLVIVTYRPAEDRAAGRPLQTLVNELSARGPSVQLVLEPLRAEALLAYLEQRFPGLEWAPVLARILAERTAGNPLFVRNLVEAWVERGAIVADEGGHRLTVAPSELTTGVPESLRALIEDQLAALAPEDLALVEAAAIVGHEFTATGVSWASDEAAVTTIAARCAALARDGRIVEEVGDHTWPDGASEPRYGFVHDLYRELLHERVPSDLRAVLHGRVGSSLEEAYGNDATRMAARLAHHFVGARDVERAVRFLLLAAHKAFGRNAFAEAIGNLRLGLDFVNELPVGAPRLRTELELRSLLGQALVATDGWSAVEVETSFTRAREIAGQLGDNEPLVPVLLALATVYEVRGDAVAAQELVEEANRLAAHASPQRRLESDEILACSFLHQGSFTRALEHAERGLQNAGEGGNGHYATFPATLGDNAGVACHDWAALAMWFLGRPDQALARGELAIRLASEPQRAYSLAAAQAQMTVLLQLRRDAEGASTWAEATAALATDLGYPYRAAMGRILGGWALGARGRHDEGLADLEEGLAAARATGVRMDDPYFLALLGETYLDAGRIVEAFDAADEAIATARRERALFYVAELLRLRARITIAAEGDPEEAEALLYDALAVAREQGARALELRAATTLAELGARTVRGRGRDVLARVYASFEEGFETPDLIAAAAQLEQQRPLTVSRRAFASSVRAPVRYAKSDGLSIAYQVTGGGDFDLVLVPGFVSHLEKDWDDPRHARFLDRLGGFARLIRFDKRGTGLSDRPQGLPHVEARMDDVRAVMDAVGSERAVVLGYSEGGPMSILFAATYPERVAALVLYGAYARRIWAEDYPWAATPEQRRAYAEQIEREWGWEADMRRMCPSADEAMALWWGERARAAASPGAARALVEMNSLVDVRDTLSAVHVPTLVLHRTHDNDVNVEESRYIAARIRGARFVELAGTDHFVAVDPDQIVDEVERFLADVDRAVTSSDRVLKTIVVVRGGGRQRADALRQVLARFGGEPVTDAREDSRALFDGPARAIQAALELRRRLDPATDLRLAVHTGEVERSATSARGIAVEVASAMAGAADDGEILVSDTTRDIVAGSDLQFEDGGVRPLAGRPEPRQLYAARG